MIQHNSSPDTLSSVKWKITEVPAGRRIYRGSRDITRNDIEIVEIPALSDQLWPRTGPKPRMLSAVEWGVGNVLERLTGDKEPMYRKQYRKRIRLEGGFYFELVECPSEERNRLLGFALLAGHEWTPTHSWEWFLIDGSGEHALKIQEGGRLRIGVERGRSGWEVGYTEFLTPVSLRMKPRETNRYGIAWTAKEPRWRIRIFKGSHITWPSVDEIERWEE